MKEFFKITENELCHLMDDNVSENLYLVDSVKKKLKCKTTQFADDLYFSVIDCESPIEQLLAIELNKIFISGGFDIPNLVDVIAIEKQTEIDCNGKKYRVDFVIPVQYWNSQKLIIIECDGHEFHQKTKDQVEKDNERTRDLQLAGYMVIRFSGTEIYHRSYKCANDVKKIIQAHAVNFIERALEYEREN